MANNFIFTDEVKNNIKSIFGDFLQGYQTTLSKVFAKANELCVKSKYELLIEKTNTIFDGISENTVDNLEFHFNNWLESDSSFSFMARDMDAGEAAVDAARLFEGSLKEMFDDFIINLKSAATLEEGIDTSQPEANKELFEEYQNAFDEANNCLKELGSQSRQKILQLVEESMAYTCIDGPISSIYPTFRLLFVVCNQHLKVVTDEYANNQQKQDEQAAQKNDAIRMEAYEAAENVNAEKLSKLTSKLF